MQDVSVFRTGTFKCYSMIIEINKPELESLLLDRMARGGFVSVEDLLLDAMRLTDNDRGGGNAGKAPKVPLGQFLLESPLRDSGLVLEREREYPKPIDL